MYTLYTLYNCTYGYWLIQLIFNSNGVTKVAERVAYNISQGFIIKAVHFFCIPEGFNKKKSTLIP